MKYVLNLCFKAISSYNTLIWAYPDTSWIAFSPDMSPIKHTLHMLGHYVH